MKTQAGARTFGSDVLIDPDTIVAKIFWTASCLPAWRRVKQLLLYEARPKFLLKLVATEIPASRRAVP